MEKNSQVLKGILEGCILKIISEQETYGYELLIKLKSSGFENIVEGTLYPLLIRLEKNKFIIAEKRKSPIGMTRKYYHLSEDGKSELNDFISYWNKLYIDVNNILGGENSEDALK